MSSALYNAFFCGDYGACVMRGETRGDMRGGMRAETKAETRAETRAEIKSLSFRALIQCGSETEARAMVGGADGALDALDEALLLYADAHALRCAQDDPQWAAVLARAARAQELGGDRDAAAAVLSIVYCWAGQLEDAYWLASQSTTLEG